VVKVYAWAAVIAVLAAAAYGLTQYGRSLERADHATKVAALQDEIAALGQHIQEYESQAADDARKIIEKETGIIHALKSNDSSKAEIRRLESLLQNEREAAAAAGEKLDDTPSGNYRIIVTDTTQRLWEAGRDCVGLPEADSASVLQKRLPEVTGDDINRLITYAQAEYCGCGIKYNELWRYAQRAIDTCNQATTQ